MLPQKIDIPIHKVLARLQFAHGTTVMDSTMQRMIDEEMTIAGRLLVPRQIIASAAIHIVNTTITIDYSYTIDSASLALLLKDCDTMYGFAVTIGPHLEEKRAMYLAAKETTRALLLDAIGSVAAEELAAITNTQIADDERTRGRTCTRRFSPGYGDWPVTAQHALLAWLQASHIGIQLSAHAQMLPEKSVSAILGAHS